MQDLKAIQEKEKQSEETALKAKCEKYATKLLGTKEEIGKLSNKHKGLWYLPIVDKNGEIEKMGIFKPISRHILSYASTKIQSEGLYIFLETCMRDTWLAGDIEILDDDTYFISAANQFNAIIDSKKAVLLKH